MSLIENDRWLEHMADEYQIALREADLNKADAILDGIHDYFPQYARELKETFDPSCGYDQIERV